MKKELVQLLEKELIPAMGCTEPIAIAYGAAVARKLLGTFPDKIMVGCSGNIIKNVKGVIVPGTETLRGIETSAVLGCVGGDPDKKLEVLSGVKKEDVEKTKEYLRQGFCAVRFIEGVENLYIDIVMTAGTEEAQVVIADTHTNIIKMKKNGQVILETGRKEEEEEVDIGRYSLEELYQFACQVDLNLIKPVLEKQITCNKAIAEEGIQNRYGANVGSTLLQMGNHDVDTMMKAYAAAGSDARMSGCEMPVVINSGSGNQGITVSVPLIKFAEIKKIPEEKLYRALLLSNLVSLYIKKGIGKLSAYCGAVSAACGTGAGIGYLCGDDFNTIARTVTNTLGNVSGIICDGAKSSCAAKIATAVDAALMAHKMAEKGMCFQPGEGLTGDNVDETIENIWHLGKEGMRETDIEILKLMVGEK